MLDTKTNVTIILTFLNILHLCTPDIILSDFFVSNLRQVSGFLPGSQVSSTNKTDSHDVIEILLKVALNTIALTLLKSFEKDTL